jgi:sugar phosphate isomerase/epimerase
MRLSTTTALLGRTRDGVHPPYIESIRRLKDIGYNVLDINFCSSVRSNTDLSGEDWEIKIGRLADEVAGIGVEISQSHPVFTFGPMNELPAGTRERFIEMMRRSIMASSMLGVKWAVLHPVDAYNGEEVDVEGAIKKNKENFAWVVDLAKKYNVGIAYENMPLGHGKASRFSNKAFELNALVDEYKDPDVGICWDFGHGNMMTADQVPELRLMGKRLKMTHVADNYGRGDDHTNPFHGNIDWYSIMPALKEIGYEGDFAFETHMETAYVPDKFRDEIACTTLRIGRYLMMLA